MTGTGGFRAGIQVQVPSRTAWALLVVVGVAVVLVTVIGVTGGRPLTEAPVAEQSMEAVAQTDRILRRASGYESRALLVCSASLGVYVSREDRDTSHGQVA